MNITRIRPMEALKQFSKSDLDLRGVFTDIDDTLTKDGKLKANAYESMWNLKDAGLLVVPITGRPAGWCEMIARFWPVDGVVGENGAFYFRYVDGKMRRWFFKNEEQRASDREKLDKLKTRILSEVPGSAIASDQFCRIADLAIDFCEDVPALDSKSVQRIVDIFEKEGAKAKVSSIHVNGWFGDYDKVSTTIEMAKQEFGMSEAELESKCVFIGDSPNDEPMFNFFDISFGVRNIEKFKLNQPPKYIATLEGGDGFTEISNHLI